MQVSGNYINIKIMDYTEEIVYSIKPILKNYGFRKKGLNWFYENQSIVKIFNIQKSQFGRQIYLNIGIKIKAIEPNISYIFPGSQIGTRLDPLVNKEILDFENNVSTESRCTEIVRMLSSNPYGFFTLSGDNESIQKFIFETGSINNVFLSAKEYLNLK